MLRYLELYNITCWLSKLCHRQNPGRSRQHSLSSKKHSYYFRFDNYLMIVLNYFNRQIRNLLELVQNTATPSVASRTHWFTFPATNAVNSPTNCFILFSDYSCYFYSETILGHLGQFMPAIVQYHKAIVLWYSGQIFSTAAAADWESS